MNRKVGIRPRDRDAIIQSLRAGVVPRRGQHHIQVGRDQEIAVLIQDVDRICAGGAAVRFIIGEYGAGKTFFLNLVRTVALEKKMVTIHGDLAPERRLHSTSGYARSLYSELMRNISTRSKPDGNAIPAIVEKFVSSCLSRAKTEGKTPTQALHESLESLSELVGGFDFAQVIEAYWRGHDTSDEKLKGDAIRWLRAEYSTKTDARKALGRSCHYRRLEFLRQSEVAFSFRTARRI